MISDSVFFSKFNLEKYLFFQGEILKRYKGARTSLCGPCQRSGALSDRPAGKPVKISKVVKILKCSIFVQNPLIYLFSSSSEHSAKLPHQNCSFLNTLRDSFGIWMGERIPLKLAFCWQFSKQFPPSKVIK